MKNNLFILVCVIFCGRAYALPQDWPCFGIEVEKYKTVSDVDGLFEYAYKGEKDGYVLNINAVIPVVLVKLRKQQPAERNI